MDRSWLVPLGVVVAAGLLLFFIAGYRSTPVPNRTTTDSGVTRVTDQGVERARSIQQVESLDNLVQVYRLTYANGDTCYQTKMVAASGSLSSSLACP